MTTTAGRITTTRSTAAVVATWTAGICSVVTFTLLAGVGLAAALAAQGGSEEWQVWSDVGQTFGVLSSIISSLALLAVVVTARMQFREMRENRAEIQRQHEFLISNHAELQRTARANYGMLHLEILRMAIDDPELGQVWPPLDPSATHGVNRQHLYANAIYSFQLIALQSGNWDERQVAKSLRYLFRSQAMRDYWRAAASSRATLEPGSYEFDLAPIVDEICAEFEAVRTSAPPHDLSTEPAVAPRPAPGLKAP